MASRPPPCARQPRRVGRRQSSVELARLREAIERSALEWRVAFDAVDSAAVVLDAEGRVRRVNRAALELCGRPYEQVIWTHISELGAGEPCRTAARLAPYVAAGQTVSRQARDETNGRVWDVSASRTAPGEPDLVVLAARDVTGVEALQESLRRQEAVSAIGELVAGVAHEVRNPLHGISATVDALEARLGRDGDWARHVAVLRTEVARLAALAADLLDYGRPVAPELRAGPLAPVIARAVEECAAAGVVAGVRVVQHIEDDLPRVPMDAARLTCAVRNLLENAILHSPAGGEVEIRAEAGESCGAWWVECRVRDSGPGFPPADRAVAFRPFHSRRHGGTGLGLSIVQRVVEQHGGEVLIADAEPTGAVVTVRLPAVPPERR